MASMTQPSVGYRGGEATVFFMNCLVLPQCHMTGLVGSGKSPKPKPSAQVGTGGSAAPPMLIWRFAYEVPSLVY